MLRRGKRIFSWHLTVKFAVMLLVFSVSLGALIYWVTLNDLARYVHRTLLPNLQQHVVYIVHDVRHRLQEESYLQSLSNRLHMDIALVNEDSFFTTDPSIRKEVIVSRKKPRRPKFKRPAKFFADDDDHDDGIEREESPLVHERVPWKRIQRAMGEVRLPGRMESVELGERPGVLYSEKDLRILILYRHDIFPIDDDDIAILFIGLGVLMLLVLLWVFQILKPLHDIRQGINAIEQGNYNKSIPVRSKDELGALSGAFNRMTARILEQFKQKEQLLADISHELRSPLTRIKLALEFMDDSKGKEMISEDVKEYELLLETLLSNARENTALGVQPVNLDLGKLLKKTHASYRNKRITLQLAASACEISGDSTLLPRVFTNLIDNAIKHADAESPIHIALVAKAQGYQVSVTDTGKGIPVNEQQRVFEAFYKLDASRTRQSGGGFGLGLNLCKRIVEAHNGSISIDPEYTQGTRIHIWLPQTM